MRLTTMDRPPLMPANTPTYMAPAWASCVLWCATDPDMIAEFKADTGIEYRPPANGLDVLIDKATGTGAEIGRRFVEWVNEKVWGDPFAPEIGEAGA